MANDVYTTTQKKKKKSSGGKVLLAVGAGAAVIYLLSRKGAAASAAGFGDSSYVVSIQGKNTVASANPALSGLQNYSGTDSADVMNSAIAALGGKGGKVSVTSGSYYLTKAISLDNSVTLQGGGMYSTAFNAITNDEPIIFIGAKNNVHIRDVYMRSRDKSVTGNTGIKIYDPSSTSNDIYINNCRMDDLDRGIHAERCFRTNITNSIIRNCKTEGIYGIGAADLHVINCMLRYNGTDNIFIGSIGAAKADGGAYVLGSYVSRAGQHGIYMKNIFGCGIDDCVVDQNFSAILMDSVEDAKVTNNSLSTGCGCIKDPFDFCDPGTSSDSKCVPDSVTSDSLGNVSSLIRVKNSSHSVVITGNDMRYPRVHGIVMDGTKAFTIADNVIRGNWAVTEPKSSGYGIAITGTATAMSSDGTITGNRIGGQVGDTQGFALDGLWLNNAKNITIVGNRISRVGINTASTYYGIREEATSQKNIFVGNILVGSTNSKLISGVGSVWSTDNIET